MSTKIYRFNCRCGVAKEFNFFLFLQINFRCETSVCARKWDFEFVLHCRCNPGRPPVCAVWGDRNDRTLSRPMADYHGRAVHYRFVGCDFEKMFFEKIERWINMTTTTNEAIVRNLLTTGTYREISHLRMSYIWLNSVFSLSSTRQEEGNIYFFILIPFRCPIIRGARAWTVQAGQIQRHC